MIKKLVILVVEPLRSGYPPPLELIGSKPPLHYHFLSLGNDLNWIENADFFYQI